MNGIPRPKSLGPVKATNQLSGFEAREAELRKKEHLEQERRRIEREKNALFGEESFVSTTAPAPTKTPPPAIVKVSTSAIPATTKPADVNQGQQVKKSGGVKLVAATAPVSLVKKSGSPSVNAILGDLPKVGPSSAPVKKAGVGVPLKKDEHKSSAASSLHRPGASSYKPPPLPDVKYVAKAASSALPSLAAWRASGGSSGAPQPSSNRGASIKKHFSASNTSKNSTSRYRDDEEEEEEEEEEEDEEEETEAQAKERRRKKKRAAEMDRMWAELRAITGYNPNDPKYRQRDRDVISESSYGDLQSEEKRSRNMGRKEDQEEEEMQRRKADEKKRRLSDWKRKNGYSDDEDEDEYD